MTEIIEKAKILMVDDEPKNLLALEAVLESLNVDLVRAHSGDAALRALMKDDFAVILLDVQMPGMDGFETAALIRSREKNRSSPIVFMTALGKTEAEMFRGYEVGAVDYLLKPFSPDILRHKVRVLVELHQKTAEIKRLNAALKEANSGLERRVKDRTEALEARGVELMRSNQELAQFAGVASHDLQEPLRTLSTYLQMVRENNFGKFSEEDRGFIEVVLDSAKRMRQLINDLLSFSQVGQGERKLLTTDCGALVGRVLDMLNKVIEDRHAKISVGPLPVLSVEPVLLGQVFQNLIENAMKFHTDKLPELDISAHEKDRMWIFAVKDNGIGIKPEHFEKIFKLFQRLHTRDNYPGTGLGLSICKKIIERHGGTIWVESVPDHGTTFFFSLPA